MNETAKKLVATGKGILAADESTNTIGKRFEQIGVENTTDHRKVYRELLFSSADAMQNHISGVILYDETIRQKSSRGIPFPEMIRAHGALVGIKVDKGVTQLSGSAKESITEGLDGLRDRFHEYSHFGAEFAKWRAVFKIETHTPSENCIRSNAHALARYAALAQECGLVPIVEPEVLMDGNHNLERCAEVTSEVLQTVFAELISAGVSFEGMLLKPNMVLPGTGCSVKPDALAIAKATTDVLKSSVPCAVPGIVFLSGGQTPQQASERLSAINDIKNLPWKVTFSYGRALQEDALKAWSGKSSNREAAQACFEHRAQMNSLASIGEWDVSLDQFSHS